MGSPRRKLDERGHESNVSPHRTLRVLFDARKLGHGGIGTTIRTSLLGLAQQAGLELSAIVRPGTQNLLPAGVSAIEDSARDLSLDHFFNFTKRLRLSQFDLLHVPHYFVPFGVNIPLVVTVHDTTHISHPEKIFYPIVARRMIAYATKKAQRVITVSQASRDCLLKLGVPESKLRVIANAAPFAHLPHPTSVEHAAELAARPSFEFLAIFSNLKPHKGLSDLLAAFSQVRCKYPDLILTLAGIGFEQNSNRLIDRAKQTPGVRVLGAQSHEQLSQLYSICNAVIVPSLAEGFGLMVTEAHAHRKAVIVRPVAALLENLAPSDICARDFSVDSLSASIASALESPLNAPSQEFLALEQRRLDPITIAAATLDIYREACR